MNRKVLIAGACAATALLGACKRGEAPSPEPSTAPSEVAAQATPSAEAPVAPAPSATSSEATSADSSAAGDIPAAIRGEWGINAADCDTASGAAKGNMQVSARRLKFYESVATLGAIKSRESSRIRATFAFEGEGQSWTQDVVLDVQDGGRQLVRRDYGPDAMPGPQLYHRCG